MHATISRPSFLNLVQVAHLVNDKFLSNSIKILTCLHNKKFSSHRPHNLKTLCDPAATSSLTSTSAKSFHSKMSKEGVDTYEYNETDFVHQTAPWVDRDAPQLSKFDLELRKRWDKAMDSGVFRYGIDHIVTRILPGPKHYVGQLNTLRATERRKPQEITSVNQPFNANAFNFTRVKGEEVIFNLKNLTEAAKSLPKQEAKDDSGESRHKMCNGITTSGCAANGAAMATVNGGMNSSSSTSSVSSESETTDQWSQERETEEERHTLIVNVSPMEYGHCLLVPQIDSHKPQVLTQTSLQVAIETMLLSRHRGFRMGFNSLCAFASVNHLHFHVYYLEHELIVDYAPVKHLGGRYFEFTALPCPGFAVQLHGTTVAEMARLAHRVSYFFHENDIAHNIFMCRGTVFGEERYSTLTTIKLFLWPRRKFIGQKSSEEFNVACIELGGHLPIKEVEGYHKLTEADVDAIIEDACLPQEEYARIRDAVIKMGQEEEQRMKTML